MTAADSLNPKQFTHDEVVSQVPGYNPYLVETKESVDQHSGSDRYTRQSIPVDSVYAHGDFSPFIRYNPIGGSPGDYKVSGFVNRLHEGEEPPPIVVADGGMYKDKQTYDWLDGAHRLWAAAAIRRTHIDAFVRDRHAAYPEDRY